MEITRMENNEFGIVRWCDDDIVTALNEKGVPATSENVQAVRAFCENSIYGIRDAMISAGWDYIYGIIDDDIFSQ